MASSDENQLIQATSTQSFSCPQRGCNLSYCTTSRLKAHIKSAHGYGTTFCYKCLSKFDNEFGLATHQTDQPCTPQEPPPGRLTAMQIAELDSIVKGIGEVEIYSEIRRILLPTQPNGYASPDGASPEQPVITSPRQTESLFEFVNFDDEVDMSALTLHGHIVAERASGPEHLGQNIQMLDTISPLVLGRRLSELQSYEDMAMPVAEDGFVWGDYFDYDTLKTVSFSLF